MSVDLVVANSSTEAATHKGPIIPCDYQCGYEDHQGSPSLSIHETQECNLRPYSCQYCQYSDTYQDVTEIHQRTCLKYPVNCPYECGSIMTRYKLMSHIESECTYVPTQCPFSWAGCNTVVTRDKLSSHVQTHQQQHLSLLTEACSSLHRDNKVLKESNESLQKSNSELTVMCNQLYSVVTGNLPTLPIKLSFNDEDTDGPIFFYSSKFGYKMSLDYTRSPIVTPQSDDSLSESERDVIFDKLELTVHSGVFDNQLQWPFSLNVKIKCIIRYKEHTQILNLMLSHKDSDDQKTLFLSPLPPLDEEEDKERFLVHVIYTGDTRPWSCESLEILSIE